MDEAAQDFWLASLGRAERFNSWVAGLVAPAVSGRVLEIGCGTGNFTGLLAGRATSVTAVDLNSEYVEAARRRWGDDPRLSFRCCDATTADWNSEFDTVVLLDVLEHIENDAGFLSALHRALRPGGALILKVPSGEWLYGSLDRAIGHYRRYTKASLGRALRNAGYLDPDCLYFNWLGILGWWLNGRLLGRTTPPSAQVGMIELLVPLLRRLERAVPLPLGLSLIAISRRPAAAAAEHG
jgi:SAM-dependent methyltransferase